MTCQPLEKPRLKLQLAGVAAVDLHCALSLIIGTICFSVLSLWQPFAHPACHHTHACTSIAATSQTVHGVFCVV